MWLEKLNTAIKEKGYSIERIKRTIEDRGEKLSRPSISNILNGKQVPNLNTLLLIADAIDIEVVTLFTNEENKKPSGFIEYDSKIYRIQSKSDLENLITLVE
ncbi:helix-turn-helix domain-containing protein [Draconibacterium mangrovi]|uniref:helix-turn-helix domain-containing protein n=1 Tax=Draconibacterium mangrovi TaxID=2697469 RepID=UPI0013D00B1C|nr:helix-turn-helix domain-containing protein [Draconibacterium mangrovi]